MIHEGYCQSWYHTNYELQVRLTWHLPEELEAVSADDPHTVLLLHQVDRRVKMEPGHGCQGPQLDTLLVGRSYFDFSSYHFFFTVVSDMFVIHIYFPILLFQN